MIAYLNSVRAPLLSILLYSSGSSLLSSLLPIRLEFLGASVNIVGLLSAVFYIGYLIGAFKIEPIIVRIGLIRTYATLASIMGVIALLHGLWQSAFSWLLLRLVYGIVLAGLFIVIETWMLSVASSDQRGRVLSFYMFTFYLAQAGGQLLLNLYDINDRSLFCVSSILISISIIPLTLTQKTTPQFSEHQRLSIQSLLKISPIGVYGCVVSGMILGCIYGLLPFVLKEMQYSLLRITYIMTFVILGGTLLQYPMGKISDYFPRHRVLLFTNIAATILGILWVFSSHFFPFFLFCTFGFLFGGLSFMFYPLGINYVCDFLSDKKDFLSAISGLIFAYGLGAILGPLIATLGIQIFGTSGFFFFLSASCASMVALILFREKTNRLLVPKIESTFTAIPKTTQLISKFLPRIFFHKKPKK